MSYNIVTVGTNKSKLKKELFDADILISIAWNSGFPPAPQLKLIQIPGAGYDNIDFSSIPKKCRLCNVYEHEDPIAEYCLLSMLESEIKLSNINDKFKSLNWSDSFSNKNFRGELLNRHLGVLGYGRIGKEIIERANAFKMHTTAIVRNKSKYKKHNSKNVKISSVSQLKKIVKNLDYLIIACPLTKETENLVNIDLIKEMKPSATIINIARGKIINENDLYEALKNKIIREAIIDVWYNYPKSSESNLKKIWPSSLPIHKLKNVTISPHTSAWTEQMLNRRFKIIGKNISNLLEGKKLFNQLN